MKTYKILFLFFILPNFILAQTLASLVTNGQGSTPLEAQHNALRSALEQSFGVYISSETKILNDILVKDEISAITNGKIIDFEILDESKITENSYLVTLKANVSLESLVNLVNSKGGNVEFEGNIFAMNIKQQQLNEKSEETVIDNLMNVLIQLLSISFDFKISATNPIHEASNENGEELHSFHLNIESIINKNLINSFRVLESTLKEMSMNTEEVITYSNQKRDFFPVYIVNKNYQDAKKLKDARLITNFSKKEFKKIDYLYYYKDNNEKNKVTKVDLMNGIKNTMRKHILPQLGANIKFSSFYPDLSDINPYNKFYLRSKYSYEKVRSLYADSIYQYISSFKINEGNKNIIPENKKFNDSYWKPNFRCTYESTFKDADITVQSVINHKYRTSAIFSAFTPNGDGSFPSPFVKLNKQGWITYLRLKEKATSSSDVNIQTVFEHARSYSAVLKLDSTKHKLLLPEKVRNLYQGRFIRSKLPKNISFTDYVIDNFQEKHFDIFASLTSANHALYFNFNSQLEEKKTIARFSFKDYKTLSEIEKMKGYTVKVKTID